MVKTNHKEEVASRDIIFLLGQIVKAARPVHWTKNLSLFAALIFSGTLFAESYFLKVFLAFIAFSFATSATYVFNDILDVESDRLHPIKKFRPYASKELPLVLAVVAIFFFVLLALYLASLLSPLFFLAVIGYLSLQTSYSLGLKNLSTVDILIIASGFMIRVYAGAFVIDAHLSVWFLLCVISVALFLAAGKRRAELGIIFGEKNQTRVSLLSYKRELLNSYVTMFGNATWMSWALFTFFESPTTTTPVWLFLAELSKATAISKLLMATIPVVIFGIMRYQALIFENKSEAPEKVLLTDKSLILSIFIWVTLVVWIIYGGVAGTGV